MVYIVYDVFACGQCLRRLAGWDSRSHPVSACMQERLHGLLCIYIRINSVVLYGRDARAHSYVRALAVECASSHLLARVAPELLGGCVWARERVDTRSAPCILCSGTCNRARGCSLQAHGNTSTHIARVYVSVHLRGVHVLANGVFILPPFLLVCECDDQTHSSFYPRESSSVDSLVTFIDISACSRSAVKDSSILFPLYMPTTSAREPAAGWCQGYPKKHKQKVAAQPGFDGYCK